MRELLLLTVVQGSSFENNLFFSTCVVNCGIERAKATFYPLFFPTMPRKKRRFEFPTISFLVASSGEFWLKIPHVGQIISLFLNLDYLG